MTGALDGVTVVDFSQFVQGPYATRHLADMGAEVLKVEPPGGDANRDIPACGRLVRGEGPFALALNRNKRSVVLDLTTDAGRAVAADLAAEADVVVENYRPGVMERFDLDYGSVRADNPEVIYASATGFGPDGPYADRPGQDLLVQALSGMASVTGTADDPPTPAGVTVVDVLAGWALAFAILAALYHRAATGEGQRVRTNLLEVALDAQCQELTAARNVDADWTRSEAGVSSVHARAPYGIYETADGYVAIASAPLPAVADVLDVDADALPDPADPEAAFRRREAVHRAVEERTRRRETEPLLEALLDADVWAAPVNDYDDLPSDPQIAHADAFVEVGHPDGGTFTTTGVPTTLSATPGTVESGPPAAGADTDAVLAAYGYDEADRERLRAAGAFGAADERE